MADAGAVVAAVDIDEAGLSATAHGREGTHTGFTSFPSRLGLTSFPSRLAAWKR